ncbi:ubiquitin carboxyl-terminal hydrolase CYLD [Kryptolebias marmoratus]|uniref:Ubiquitin carboxyl-terminal hydrolase CYLD n=1 Tax=Kryptolebias marmoratus TaxID=37003 RepID=A0A3Q3B4X6_KRYMA|nr:ubiquitin carboxyl-terminal hydrolase CYLD [Kryptolebias marmoratus]
MTDPSSSHMFFIITEKPKYPGHIRPGAICFIRTYKYESEISKTASVTKLRVLPLPDAMLDYDIEMNCMKPLTEEKADLLLAMAEEDRLKWFRDRKALQTALGLTVGTAVTVEEDQQNLRGVIRYIGPMIEPSRARPITGRFFGIELQGEDKGKGNNNGIFGHKQHFTCEKNCGVFAPFSRVRPVAPSSLLRAMSEPSAQPETEELSPGDRVTYFTKDKSHHGMVVSVEEEDGKPYVRISTDVDESGKTGGEVKVSIEMVAKGEVPSGPESMIVDSPPVKTHTDLHMGLNSMVEVTLATGNAYGIIRWMGLLPERNDVMVGLELEEDNGVSDGTFKGCRFFTCPPKRALFVKPTSCRPDSRFQTISANHCEKMPEMDKLDEDADYGTGNLECFPPVSTEQVNQILIGRMKGIQGHCNSCYMDAAFFGLFACSSVLDSMLFKSTTPQDAPIQRTLLRDIVNPLRSKGFVEGQHIMKFRMQLQRHGYSHSFTTDEKDPEEFLNIVMHHILALDPLLKLSAAGKVQDSYCYQIFLDQNHSLVLPTVQQLLEHSFHSAGLKLAEVPSCLILQMPRFGKKFKMFDKIIPSLELDITDLLSEGPQQCILCGNLAVEECTDCFKEHVFSPTGFKVFCRTCSAQVHNHPQRRSHQPVPLEIPKGYLGRGIPHTLTRDRLELFAVLCIETSHYVSFVKHGPNNHDWIFFDSMADRQGEMDGFNIPEVQACPEVGMYLEMSPIELANQAPRDMKGVAKRLFCDAYMYLYQSTSMCLYR